jgi:hypothetical protein
MKIFYVLALLAIFFSSCQKEISQEPPTTSNNGASTGTFTAVINGKNWQASPEKQAASILQGTINVTGVSSDGQTIVISIMNNKPGTYNTYEPDPAMVAYMSSNSIMSHSTNGSPDSSKAGGQITISSIDTVNKTIAGTFTSTVFVADDQPSISITGSFNLSYATTITDINGNSTTTKDTVKAIIDGKAWTAPVVSGMAFNGIVISSSAQDMSRTLGFKLPEDVTVGTYKLDGMFSNCNGLYGEGTSVTETKNFFAGPGTLTVTEHNKSKKHIAGTFEFTASDLLTSETRQITKGYFSVTYK